MIWAEAHKKYEACLVALILVAQLGLLIAAARANDPVADERSTYLYGQRILNEGRFDRVRDDRTRIFNSKMPVAALAALPQYLAEQAKVWPFIRLGESIGPVNPRHPHIAYKFWSRLAMLSLAPLLGLIGYLWSRRLYGRGPALVVLLLLVLSPNLSAFLGLILNDGPAIIAFFGAIFLFRRFTLAPSPGRLIWAGAGLGLALLTKNSTVMVPPLVCLAWGLEKWPEIRTLLARRDWTGLVKGIRFCLIALTGWLIAAGLVLNTGFGWQGFGHTLAGIKPQSAVLRHLPPALQALPLPLPRAFTVGLDMIRYDDQNAETNSMIYFNGLRRHFSPPEYFAVGLGLKLPLAILILLGWAAIRKWSRDSTPDDPWLIVPAVVLGLQISFGMGLVIGTKYILPIVPFLLVFCGRLFIGPMPKLKAIALAGLIVWTGWSTLSQYPNYLAHFNELTPSNQVYRRLANFDLDVGQAYTRAKRWSQTHRVSLIATDPPEATGPALIKGNLLLGNWTYDLARVMRECYRPKERVVGSYFLFDRFDNRPRQWRTVWQGDK